MTIKAARFAGSDCDAMFESNARWLRIAFIVGAITDGVALLPMVFPSLAKILWGLDGMSASFWFAMHYGAALMLGWTGVVDLGCNSADRTKVRRGGHGTGHRRADGRRSAGRHSRRHRRSPTDPDCSAAIDLVSALRGCLLRIKRRAPTMTEAGQASSNNWRHLASVGSLALGAIGVVSILHRSHAVDFQPYFGNLHPVAAVALAGPLASSRCSFSRRADGS
jgi:hypothetical protein